MVEYFLIYLVLVAISFVLTTMKEHGYATKEWPSLMYAGFLEYRPAWVLNAISSLIPLVGFIACASVMPSGGFKWPRKGVTYLKELQ